MRNRVPILLLVMAGISTAPLLAQASRTAGKTASAPHPDLSGIWTNVTLTPLERPASLAAKGLTLSDEEARAYEKSEVQATSDIDKDKDSALLRAAGSAGTGAYNALFIDRGSELARVNGQKRTSLIVDPPNGKVPALVPERQKELAGLRRNGGAGATDNIKQRPLAERCILGFGSTSGPPMLPVLYNNNYQIIQTPDTVMILVEMVHDARVIRINGQHASPSVRQWMGDSIGHWDGNTLVVDTTNFTDQTRFRGSTESLHVVERFRKTGGNTILYRATVEDPKAFTTPWTLEYPFVRTEGPIYEYACHEGNYAVEDILGAARKADSER